jgi:hypothetical protein
MINNLSAELNIMTLPVETGLEAFLESQQEKQPSF